MIRTSARAVALIGLLLAWGAAAGDRLTLPLVARAHAAARADDAAPQPSYDLASLSIFNRVVLLVKENYFDPRRIDPKAMLVDSLDAVEKQVPEVMVDGDPKAGRVKVTVGGATREFSIADIDSIFKMSMRLHQMMGFVQQNLSRRDDAKSMREIEYALVNGMLTSLDPHSVVLKPEYFKEMKLSTKGEFGGLGFVISMREGDLTVMKVLKGTKDNPTPAVKAGIKPKDRILRIEDESTVNMELNSAVERLRGKPGSKITLTVARNGWPEPRQITVARAKIEIESIDSRLLANRVGYVRIKNFQGNTARDLHARLRELRDQAGGKLAGLVLDLRGNPGGLLEQAIQVSDVFLSSGTIVSTVGMSDKLREVKRARPDPDDVDLPLAVLVNNGSASASEIVAGAVKNLDRGVVVGRTTFGKGSVQVLYDFPDESALKLTIAQYLTPGDVSIQETGIVPDIELVPSRVTQDLVSVFAPLKSMREADLDHHLTNPGDQFRDKAAGPRDPAEGKAAEKPLYSLRHLRDDNDKKPEDEEEEEDPELDDDFVEDFQIRFARDLLVAAPFPKRSQIVGAMKTFVPERTRLEDQRIAEAIEKLGVSWAPAPAAAGARQLSAVLTPSATDRVEAGQKIALTLEVTNTGTAPIHQLHAWTEAESNPLIDRREFLFGALAPGAKRSWTVPIELPRDLASRRDPLVVKFEDDAATPFPELRAELGVVEQPRPLFAFSWQVIDRGGDGDGLPDPGEKLSLVVDVKNVGAGPSSEVTFGSLKNEGDEKIFIEKGRYKLGALAPGASAQATFELELKKGYQGETVPVRLTIFDEKLEELLGEKLQIPVDGVGRTAAPTRGALRTTADLAVRAAPLADAPPLATARKGAVLPVDARLGEWARVEWAKGRLGFVKPSADDKVLGSGRASGTVEPALARTPPLIQLDADPLGGGAAVDGDRFTLSGTVTDPELRDVFVYVNDQKVFFATPEANGGPLRFRAEFPLKEGSNHVVVIARETEDVSARRAFTVLRRKAVAAAQPASP